MKIYKIKNCEVCPYFEWIGMYYYPKCSKKKKDIKFYKYKIPDWCPLEDYEEGKMDMADLIISKNTDIQKIEKNVQILSNRLLELEKENHNLKKYKKAWDDLADYIKVLQESYKISDSK